jgi:hypothetical protein
MRRPQPNTHPSHLRTGSRSPRPAGRSGRERADRPRDLVCRCRLPRSRARRRKNPVGAGFADRGQRHGRDGARIGCAEVAEHKDRRDAGQAPSPAPRPRSPSRRRRAIRRSRRSRKPPPSASPHGSSTTKRNKMSEATGSAKRLRPSTRPQRQRYVHGSAVSGSSSRCLPLGRRRVGKI